MRLLLDTRSCDDYRSFLRIKSLPKYRFIGNEAEFPDEYAPQIAGKKWRNIATGDYVPRPFLFDYQRDIAALAIRKRKFSVFADCGLGKTLIFLEYARHVAAHIPPRSCILIVSPLMVISQTLRECHRWYGDELAIEQVRASDLRSWLERGDSRIGITNYDALTDDIEPGRLACLILDESSMLKSQYGKWGQVCLRLGRGLDWKLAGTGTPAPNDRIEYGNHAVLMDASPTLNSFLARYFVNRGQTCERWELKPHALKPFYRSLSHWCIFLSNPGVYGWNDNCKPLPPIQVHIHEVALTSEQQNIAYIDTGKLFADTIGGITGRSSLGQLAKGHYRGRDVDTHKPGYIRQLVESWPDESTIIWCLYNREQDLLERQFPQAGSIRGDTPYEERQRIIDEFKRGDCRILISKPKVLGFGLNLEIATRQVFSGLQDSYESFYQAVKRSNRYGATRPLNVHIPVTDIERPMIETVLKKASRVNADTKAQEEIFKDAARQWQ
jgi:superfamily II DNA or RNA helicase